MNSTFMKPRTVMLFRRMSLMEAGSQSNDGFAKVSSLESCVLVFQPPKGNLSQHGLRHTT
jgi:hypothetical protein